MALAALAAGAKFLAPAIPQIAAGIGQLFAPRPQQPAIRAGTPLPGITGQPGGTLAQQRAGVSAMPQPAWSQAARALGLGAPAPARPTVTSTQGVIAPNRGSARPGQYYYTSTGKVYKKGRKKKKKIRRRARLTKREKFKMIAQAAAGGASKEVISILLMM